MNASPGKPKTAKEGIIHTLSTRFPLTAKQLTHVLQREHGMELTYQAVHKALQELEKETILLKNNSHWQLNPAWLEKQERFFQTTKKKYAGKTNRYDIDLNYDGPQVFEFDSFTDFCVETANLVGNKIFYPNQKMKAYFLLEYGWWTFKFRFAHLKVLHRLMKSSPEGTHLIRKNTPFGKWMQKQYERVGAIGKIGINFPFDDDLLIQGDWVVQVHFSEESKKIITKYWKKWKTLEDSFKEFGLKPEPKMKITATVTKNPTMAKFMSQEIDKYLKEASNHAR